MSKKPPTKSEIEEQRVYRHAEALLQLVDSPRAVGIQPEAAEVVNELMDVAVFGDRSVHAAQLAVELIVHYGLLITTSGDPNQREGERLLRKQGGV